ncbi:hypothetical protein DERF_001895 [Dermatophagoides farinae]|uniref:Secreted protein n=1 Tax=Dermatophagoides farinae TaxID=6954 RepID=A0A922IBR8_DERFA|nr:hypothetical protein DERF_001895 [Dermatophagoides farinae]
MNNARLWTLTLCVSIALYDISVHTLKEKHIGKTLHGQMAPRLLFHLNQNMAIMNDNNHQWQCIFFIFYYNNI